MGNYNREELTDEGGILLRVALQGLQSGIWTALPGIITKFNAAQQTCEVQLSVKGKVLDSKGVSTWVQLPLLVDCPVVFPSGGGFVMTFPLAVDDEVLVVFASRCIDSWWQSGGIQVQAELRMHDLSDGFVIPGPRSLPNVAPAISTDNVELRSLDGTTKISMAPDGTINLKTAGNVKVVAGGEADVTAPAIKLVGHVTITGDVTVTGKIDATGKVTALDLATPLVPSYALHNHGGVTTGSGFTNIPFPGS